MNVKLIESEGVALTLWLIMRSCQTAPEVRSTITPVKGKFPMRASPCHTFPMVLVALLATAVPASADDGVSADKIVFGQATALEGPASALGQGMKMGLEAAFAEINKAGGVKGRQLELKSIDDGYEPTKSIEAVKKLLEEDKVSAIAGAVGTPTAAATQPIATAAGAPFIGAFTGAEFLREPYKPLVLNIRASYFQETEAMVEHLTKDLGASRIAIMYQDDAFGQAGLAGVKKALEKVSGDPTRQALIEAVQKAGTLDLDGFKLVYSPSNNRGSDQVFLTVIQPDGSFKAVDRLEKSGS